MSRTRTSGRRSGHGHHPSSSRRTKGKEEGRTRGSGGKRRVRVRVKRSREPEPEPSESSYDPAESSYDDSASDAASSSSSSGQHMRSTRRPARRGKHLGGGVFGDAYTAVDADGDLVVLKKAKGAKGKEAQRRERDVYRRWEKKSYRDDDHEDADEDWYQGPGWYPHACWGRREGTEKDRMGNPTGLHLEHYGPPPWKPKGPELSMAELVGAYGRLADGLVQLHHGLKMAHLDIKHDNVMYDSDTGELVMVDWGQGQDLREDKGEGPDSRRGYRPYCPPEYNRGRPTDAASHDTWSLAAMFLETVCGVHWTEYMDENYQLDKKALKQVIKSVRLRGLDRTQLKYVKQALAGAMAPSPRDRISDEKFAQLMMEAGGTEPPAPNFVSEDGSEYSES